MVEQVEVDGDVIMWSCVLQPERINPETNQKGYNVKSDIWSLGITMVSQPLTHTPGCPKFARLILTEPSSFIQNTYRVISR